MGPKSVIFDIIDDDEVEEEESFKVSLSSGDPVGLEKPAFVKIVDNDGMCILYVNTYKRYLLQFDYSSNTMHGILIMVVVLSLLTRL